MQMICNRIVYARMTYFYQHLM